MLDQPAKLEILASVAEEIVTRYRRGEHPEVTEYSAKHPELSEEIRIFLSALVSVEDLAVEEAGSLDKPNPGDAANGSQFRQIGDFRIIRQVGRGGMGIVYEAEQLSLGRHVALKVLPQQVLLDEQQKRRFEREARSAAKLHHTNIVPVFGVGESNGLHYYVMQFIEGLGLDEVLHELQRKGGQGDDRSNIMPAPVRVSRRDLAVSKYTFSLKSDDSECREDADSSSASVTLPEAVTIDTSLREADASGVALSGSTDAGRLSDTFTLSDSSVNRPSGEHDTAIETQPRDCWQSVANIGVQVASALQYAHEQGVLHRDIKPSNLLLDTHGTVWVLDFGLAKASDQHDLTGSGHLLGTLRYMPPEAFEGRTDARSDIYSLGLTLYELLALQPAFNETSSSKLIKQLNDREPTRLDKLDPKIPRDLVTIVHKAIATDPDRRYQSSGELADDLKRFLNDEPIRARRTSVVEHVRRWARRNRALAAAVAVIALLLVTINIAGPLLTLRLKRAYDSEVAARRRALQAEQVAVDSLGLAKQKEYEAMQSLELARDREQALNRTLYRAEMSLAGQAAAERTGIQRVRSLTSAWRPSAGTEDLRDWEWYYLHGLGRLAKQTLEVEGGNAESVAWSPCGNLIAYGQDDGTVVIWNVRAARPIVRKNLHSAHVLDICWSSDGTKLASLASQDNCVRVWEPLTGNELQRFELPGANDWSGSVSLSHDNRLLAADARDKIAIWNLQTGQLLRTLDMDEVAQVAWSPVDNRIAASSKHHRITVWDGLTGEQMATYQAGTGCLAWGPQGNRLALAGKDRRIHILDLSSERKTSCSLGHVAEVTALAWNDDGTQLASVGKDSTLRIWDPETGVELARLRGHAGSVTSLAWNSRAALLATTARDQTVKIWQTDSTDEQLVLHGYEDPVKSTSWGLHGRRLATSSGSWTSLWDVDRRSEVRQYQGQRVAMSPTGARFAIAVGASIEIHDAHTKALVATLVGHSKGITTITWNKDGSRLASASWDSTARIWNPTTGETLTTIPLSHRDRQICWSPDGVHLAAIGNRDVQVWDVQQGTRQLQFPGKNQIHAIAWSPDGRYLATGGWDHEITIWEASTARTVVVLTGHTSPVTSLCWNPAGTRLVSGSEDQLVRIWDVGSRGELLSLQGHEAGVTSVSWSPDGMRIASGDQLGRIVVWDATLGHLHERTPQALSIINRRISANPSLGDLAIRADILERIGRSNDALVDRRRIRLVREEQLEELLEDSLTVELLAAALWAEVQAEAAASWVPLSPFDMKATDGATLDLQPDESILVTGPNTAGVQYEIAATVEPPITGLRLEAIPDVRLPHGGSGRATQNGNFHLAEVAVVAAESTESENVREIAIEICCDDAASHLPEGRSLAKAIDGNRKTLWDTHPNHKQPHWAVFQFAQPLTAEGCDRVIRVRLDSGISSWGPHGLGRFRLSVTNAENAVEHEQLLKDLDASRSNGIVFLAGAYAYLGKNHRAAAAFATALRRADNRVRRRNIVALAARFDGVVCELTELLPRDPWLMLVESDLLVRNGRTERATGMRAEALSLLLRLAPDEPEPVLRALGETAVAYRNAGHFQASLQVLRPAYARSRELLTKEHPCSIDLLGELAEAFDRMGRCDEAQTLLEEEFALRRSVQGIDDAKTLASGRQLADLYARSGQVTEAIKLRVRIAQAAPLDDLNSTQQAAFFLLWNDDAQGHSLLCRRLVAATAGAEFAKVARDAAKAVLMHPTADTELVEAAARLAARSADLTPSNLWSVLSVGMSHYRQGDYFEATDWLSRAAEAPTKRLSLLARVFLAMTRFREKKPEEAREQLQLVEKGFGLIAFSDLQSPFTLHHDDLAIWLALQEARRTIGDEPAGYQESVDRLLEFQQQAVNESPDDTLKSLHLAILFAWFQRDAAHRDLCGQLLAAAKTSQKPRDLERAAQAYLVDPNADLDLLVSAATSAETAVELWQENHELLPWAQMAAGIAAYRQQRYTESIALLNAAQQSTNRLIKGPSLLFRSMAYLRQDQPEQAEEDFVAAAELMKPFPNMRLATEAIRNYNELVFWLAYDEANRLLTAGERNDE